ncbi:HEAT repeat protein [Methanomicrobium sp. W14]|uniref:HEAT repeat domain-containing protein n=1 Tax=Methanomicrobium sp. W14 TaxID=2817839 RepID=UPI001AE2B3AD|nr:HEAT repeat domain-containing protein [Methanomicrobium sp. W14]MBP2133431.1 HEAT repeat protein [Methanomicrobium sp. W14]
MYDGLYERIHAERMRREKENFEIYIKQLKDPGIPYRTKAAEALGNYKDPRAVPYLIECAKCETDPGVLYVAICSLAKFRDKSSVVPLLALLDHSDKWVRSGAAKALGEIGDRESVFCIKPMLSDENPKIRASAAEALGLMSYWEFADLVIPLLDDEESEVRAAARAAVRKLGRGDLAD